MQIICKTSCLLNFYQIAIQLAKGYQENELENIKFAFIGSQKGSQHNIPEADALNVLG